jgi:hypothetical protein
MKRIQRILMLSLAGLVLLALPVTNFAQGRGRGQAKKFDKFVNGHDARDGRWDGRGPAIGRRSGFSMSQQRGFGNRRWNDDNWRRDRWWESRRRRFDNEDFNRWQRLRYRNRTMYQRSIWR